MTDTDFSADSKFIVLQIRLYRQMLATIMMFTKVIWGSDGDLNHLHAQMLI